MLPGPGLRSGGSSGGKSALWGPGNLALELHPKGAGPERGCGTRWTSVLELGRIAALVGSGWLSPQMRKLDSGIVMCTRRPAGSEVHFLFHSPEPCASSVILLTLKLRAC